MNPEEKTLQQDSVQVCQSCKKQFIIEPEDFTYYKKIDVPAPTFCPQCRLQRRLAWLKGFRLYKRVCGLCDKDSISMYPPDAPYAVYCHKCWWSDNWNPLEYGQEYDLNRPFLEQFNELLHRVPLRSQPIDTITGELSPYTNHAGHCKNCYLIFYSEGCEDSTYGFYLVKDKQVLDCSILWECEQCYDSMNGFKNYRVHGSRGNVHESTNCYFTKDSKNIQHCFASTNLRNKKYVFFNEQLTKKEYEEKLSKIDLGSYKKYQEMKTKAEELWKQSIPHPYYDYFSVNCTGNYIFHSKNCKECYDSAYCEDCKYVMLIKQGPTKDCYDFTDFGWNAERIYEGITIGNGVSDVRFSQDCHIGHHVNYSKSCIGGSNLFGCVSLRNRDYCILNKQYDRESFEALRSKIIKHMNDMPYMDAAGRKYRYGEFFPMEFSPHDYNDTFAHMFYPKTKNEVINEGLCWRDNEKKEYDVTIKSEDIPDHIKDAKDSVLKEVIQCNQCSRGFKIIHSELQFLRQHNLPLPRQCPFCRIEAKVKRWVWQMTLVQRTCDNCGTLFRTNYRLEDAPRIYCKECYNKEIL